MEKNLLARINHHMEDFSKGQKKIANYLLEHYEKSVYLTAAKLSDVVGVSESTVVRFAIELGYDGYPRFQKALEEIVKSELTPRQRMELTAERTQNKNKHPLRIIMERDADRIHKTLNEVNYDEFDNVVKQMTKAKKIYILAGRSSSALGSFMYFYLNLMLFDVEFVEIGSKAEIFEQLIKGGTDSLCFCISFPRYSRRTIQGLEYAKSIGMTTISLTDSSLAPVAKLSDYMLLAKSDMISVVDSLVGPMTIINGLLVALSLNNKEEILKNFDKLEELWNKHNIYETAYYIREAHLEGSLNKKNK
ncbi:MAG: MurR/RpiR family transcriptional regulator [Lachnospirales bacterium]